MGDLVRATHNNHMRPAHMHAIVSAPGYQQVITHVFVEGDPYLDGDAVFAVKNSLIAKYRKMTDAEAKMPELGRNLVHAEGVALIRQWITEMTPTGCPTAAR